MIKGLLIIHWKRFLEFQKSKPPIPIGLSRGWWRLAARLNKH
ncbi:hypothetical protein VPHK356_0095 [Vibrio phage K356]